MNIKDFRAKAYMKNAKGEPVPVEDTESLQKTVFTIKIHLLTCWYF